MATRRMRTRRQASLSTALYISCTTDIHTGTLRTIRTHTSRGGAHTDVWGTCARVQPCGNTSTTAPHCAPHEAARNSCVEAPDLFNACASIKYPIKYQVRCVHMRVSSREHPKPGLVSTSKCCHAAQHTNTAAAEECFLSEASHVFADQVAEALHLGTSHHVCQVASTVQVKRGQGLDAQRDGKFL